MIKSRIPKSIERALEDNTQKLSNLKRKEKHMKDFYAQCGQGHVKHYGAAKDAV